MPYFSVKKDSPLKPETWFFSSTFGAMVMIRSTGHSSLWMNSIMFSEVSLTPKTTTRYFMRSSCLYRFSLYHSIASMIPLRKS